MSSDPTPKLLDLAPELVDNVIKRVSSRRDLSNVRLTCKALDEHAAKELFKDIYLSPSDIQNWNSISQDDTSDIERDSSWGGGREHEEINEDYETALAALSKFPNLDSVEIGFTPECIGKDHDYYKDVAEEVEQREYMLELIFQAIKDRATDEKNRTIRKLTIVNLQNCPLPEFTSSDLFRDVMGQLEELHIEMIQEYNEPGPDHDYTKVELQTFPAYFCSHWLKPISANLRALSIYSKTDNWGPFPGYFDPSGISFPKLETLALAYYTLAHDSDLDWILAIKSLRKLILHSCMIASWIRIGNDNMQVWQPPMHDWTKMSEEEEHSWAVSFAYGTQWSQYLDRIAGGLPNLIDFRFDQSGYRSQPGCPYGVNDRDSCGTRIFAQRYICFDNGILPTHWPEAEEDGSMYSWLDDGFPVNKHAENLEADQNSLDRLLEKLGKRRSFEPSG
ncbi:hypothetical protein BU23DRAFT_594257 [Bimuria novae-zelandiae CBS 107.79]|uniref:F-box domain-containing protein n=1 Tax=Bimuria novae-zelandiae CBS 107.79 TaxID=1447943 RepID=A0A6A5UMJ1_9PLEO|nr:hypothetical protein BU23DRAFT_594257 [Bimuria novae-zelandiae CBS 107.79]